MNTVIQEIKFIMQFKPKCSPRINENIEHEKPNNQRPIYQFLKKVIPTLVINKTVVSYSQCFSRGPSSLKIPNIFLFFMFFISSSMCNKVPKDVKKEFQIALKDAKDDKNKRTIMLRESNVVEHQLSSKCGSTAIQPKVIGLIDKYVASEAKQTVLNEACRKELRKDVCRMVGCFMFSRVLPFNTVNDPFLLAMVEGIAKYGVGFKPPSMHELRTWILREKLKTLIGIC